MIAAIGIYALVLTGYIVGISLTWNNDQPSDNTLANNDHWQNVNPIDNLRLLRIQELDSASQQKHIQSYLLVEGLKPTHEENGQYYIIDQTGKKSFVQYSYSNPNLLLPVSYSSYKTIKIIAFALLGISLAIALWMGIKLSQFAGKASEKTFFTVPNMRKLQMIGWVTLSWGAITYIIGWNIPRLIETFIGYGGIKYHQPYIISEFPGWILFGLLLLLISKAFQKGIEMQVEEDFTV